MFHLPPMLPDGHKNPELTLETKGAVFTFQDGSSLNLPDIKQKFHRLLVIKGRIGSGKTLLLKALANIVSPSEGYAGISGVKDLNTVYVHSQGEFNFVTGSIGEEMDFTGIPRGIFGELEKRGVNELSGGELKRIAVMMALGADNNYILLDEPLDMLDDAQAQKTADYIVTYANIKPIIIATHDSHFDSHADAIIKLDGGTRLSRGAITLSENVTDNVHLETAELSVKTNERQLAPVSMTLHEGELLCVYGANGSGKTLFIKEVAGIGHHESAGTRQWHVDKMGRGICLQFPEQMMYREKVSEEISDIAGNNLVDEVLSALGWEERGEHSPFSLSDGEKRAMYIISMLLSKKCCVFDEPFTGLDAESAKLLEQHFTAARERGCSILYTTNRRRDMLYADSVIKI